MKKNIAALLAFIVVISILLLCYFKFSPTVVPGDKTITVEINHSDGTVRVVEIKTDEEFLRGAMEQEGLLSGDESEYGLFVKTVDDETVAENTQEWWGYTKSGVYVEYGVDNCPIVDGEHYEFTFNVGW